MHKQVQVLVIVTNKSLTSPQLKELLTTLL